MTKVSVGVNHACALANADVYCWGNNTYGQLGTRNTTNSAAPVAVDKKVASTTTVPASQNCVLFWCTTTPAHTVTVPASALSRKEIIDIAAGENFTCALASDGSVACWGQGANGRLGTNNTNNANFPQPVYATAGSALSGKKGIKLAKVSGSPTMCVMAAVNPTEATAATPYCWGMGMGTGALPANKTEKCGKTSGNTTSSNVVKTTTTYFDSSKPVDSSGVAGVVRDIDTYDTGRITGIGNDSRAYYWGLSGYVATMRSGTPKCTWTESSGGGNVNAGTGKPCGGGGGNSGSPGCGGGATVTKHNYTEYYTYARTGSTTSLGPVYNSAASPLAQKTFTAASGNAYDGLFCAKVDSGTYCDAHGTEMTSGQTGSNYTQACTTTYTLGIFPKTTCEPDPVGPQKVVTTTGWLAGRDISELSTSGSGHTCAVAGGELGCWGANGSGQLGVGDTTARKVPTKVNI